MKNKKLLSIIASALAVCAAFGVTVAAAYDSFFIASAHYEAFAFVGFVVPVKNSFLSVFDTDNPHRPGKEFVTFGLHGGNHSVRAEGVFSAYHADNMA